jgi:hypothetical protein
VRALHQRIERAVLGEQLHRSLGPDLVDARHVVHRVSDQRLVVHHQAGRDAELRFHSGHVPAAVVHRVDDNDMLVHQLAQVLVAAGDHCREAALGRHARQRADHIVGFHAGHVQHLPAEQLHDFVDRWNLGPQVVGHR